MKKVISQKLSVLTKDYIIYISEDIAGLSLEFVNNPGIQPAKDSEDAVSKQDTYGIEDNVIDIHRPKSASKYKRNDKLNDFECRPNCNCQPKHVLGFDTGDEIDPKAKRHR